MGFYAGKRLIVGAIVAGLLLGAGAAIAKPHARKVRQQVAELNARLAQLESRMRDQARQLDMMAPRSALGLCEDPCALDSDGDGEGDCVDVCPCDPSNRDDDADGIPDCVDPCPGDVTNGCIDPCQMDSDNDETVDCQDVCPWDSHSPSDHDGDGISDCNDPCPDDDHNDCSGPCLLDSDGDGFDDCMDPCPFGGESGLCGEHHMMSMR